MRLDDAITLFLDEWPWQGPRLPSASTVKTYRGHLGWLCGFAAKRRKLYTTDLDAPLLREAIRSLLEEARQDQRAANYKGGEASARGVAFAARALARWLLAQGVPVGDLSEIRPPRPPERIQVRLKPEEFGLLEHAVLKRLVSRGRQPRVTISRDLALLYLLADSGLRANEVCAMTLDDVDFDGGRILVRRGKGGKQRMLSILDPNDSQGGETLKRLSEWIDMRDNIALTARHRYLWVSMKGRPLNANQLRYILRRLCDDAGVDGNRPPHAFRRATFTERYKADPSSLNILAARMGWSKKSHDMVDVYTRGAELDLAASESLPSMATLWRQTTSPKTTRPGGTHPKRTRDTLFDWSVVPQEALKADDWPRPTVGGKAGNQSLRRASRGLRSSL